MDNDKDSTFLSFVESFFIGFLGPFVFIFFFSFLAVWCILVAPIGVILGPFVMILRDLRQRDLDKYGDIFERVDTAIEYIYYPISVTVKFLTGRR